MKPAVTKDKIKKFADADFIMETLTDETLGPHAHLALLLIIVVITAIAISLFSSYLGT